MARPNVGTGLAPVPAPLPECGVTPEPYVMLPVLGRPIDAWLARAALSDEQAVRHGLPGCLVLLGLALSGLMLPEADGARFLGSDASRRCSSSPTSAACSEPRPDAGLRAHRDLARAGRAAMESARPDRQLPFASLEHGSPSLADLVRAFAGRS